jgi:hypothetical protein
VLTDQLPSWRLYPLVTALQALRGVQDTVAVPRSRRSGDLTRSTIPGNSPLISTSPQHHGRKTSPGRHHQDG